MRMTFGIILIGISLFIVTIGVLAFRFIVSHMPILYEHPDYIEDH